MSASGFSCGGVEPAQGQGNANCASGVYVGNLHGLQATARVQVEQLREVTYVGGEITSQTAHYLFKADLWGERGWGDMIDMYSNERFRIQIDVLPGGFILTVARSRRRRRRISASAPSSSSHTEGRPTSPGAAAQAPRISPPT